MSGRIASVNPVYRIFFKDSATPTDISTPSVWGLCRHKGVRANSDLELGYYQKAPHMTSLRFPGNRVSWDDTHRPANVAAEDAMDHVDDSASEISEDYLQVDNIAGVFHRNQYVGTGSPTPKLMQGNAYKVFFNDCGGASMEVLAGGWIITSQPTIRMVEPSGDFDTVKEVIKPKSPMIYFWGYGGQFYADEYVPDSTGFSYEARYGLGGSAAVGTDTVRGTPISIDTGATYLPLNNVRAILQITAGDQSDIVIGDNESYIVDEDAAVIPIIGPDGTYQAYNPAEVGFKILLPNSSGTSGSTPHSDPIYNP